MRALRSRSNGRRIRSAGVLATALLLVCSAGPAQARAPRPALPDTEAWAPIRKLIDDQKFEAAADQTARLRLAARARGDEATYTRALIQEVELRSALQGYERAVRLLQTEPWPRDGLWQAALHLFQARQLVLYFRTRAVEVNQREALAAPAGPAAPDLRAWTRDEIFAAAQREYRTVWSSREALGQKPLSALAGYLEPNDFPQGLRDTLRDAVTYLWVEQLADTSQWTAEQLNATGLLDAAALVAGDPAASSRTALDDSAVHPLLKLGAVLDDLEAWHLKRKQPEAALEARLERARRLQAALDTPEARDLVVRDLEARLPSFASLPWWSMGMATLAELVEGRDGPDDLVGARAVALKGAKAFPDSPGSLRCQHIVARIEAPAFELQGMSTDAANRRSVQVRHKNLTAIWFRAYRLDVEAHIVQARNLASLVPGGEEMRALLESGRPVQSWRVDLPVTPDHRMHRTFVTPPLQTRGGYLLVASAREDFRAGANQILGLPLFISDLVLVTRPDARGAQVTVLSGETGRPVPGARVEGYRFQWGHGFERSSSGATDSDGVALLAATDRGGPLFVLARQGDDLAVEPDAVGFAVTDAPSEARASFVYTDRGVYRPLQKILWKVAAYRGDPRGAQFEASADEKLEVVLYDANHQPVDRQTVTTNRFGSAAGEFAIPPGRLLGAWTVATRGGQAVIRVEEYKRPTFEVEVLAPAQPLRLNAPAALVGQARYHFGLPVDSGAARWRVTRLPIAPGPRGPHAIVPARGAIVASGSAKLGPDGRFAFEFTPRANAAEEGSGNTYRYSIDVDVTDEGGETRSATRTMRLGWVELEATLAADGFFDADTPSEVVATLRDLDGNPRPGSARWRLVSLRQPPATPLPADLPPEEATANPVPGDLLRPRFEPNYSPESLLRRWPDGEEQAQGEVAHDPQGQGRIGLPALAPGAYRLRYRTTDAAGKVGEATRELIVAGPGLGLALPALLVAQRPSVSAQGPARLLVWSGLPEQRLLLEVQQSGRPLSRQWLDSSGANGIVELPVGAARRGGFVVQLVAVRDHQVMALQQHVEVPWGDRALKVELATFRDRLRPGGHESWRVAVRGAGEDALATGEAELLAYMYDRSLDLIAPHAPPRPLAAYPRRDQPASLRFSLRAANPQWVDGSDFAPLPGYPSFVGDRLVNLDGYGVGGLGYRGGLGPRVLGARAKMEAPAEASALAESTAPRAPEAALRQDFAETALWQPQLRVGADGSAAVEFEVPDSVTSWSFHAHALTADLRAGSVTAEARSFKDLMVRPYLPRFLREGDTAELQVEIHNARDTALPGALDFDLIDPRSGASVAGDFGLKPEQCNGVHFAAPAGGSANLTFTLTVPARVGDVAVRVQARAGDLSDGEQRRLPVLPSRVHLMQSRFASLPQAGTRTLRFEDLARRGDPTRIDEGLVVTLDGQLFTGVLAALPYLVDYPYECTEQTLNRFVSTGIVGRVYRRYPDIAKLAESLSARTTPLERFERADPNRSLAYEETPWLAASRGGADAGPAGVNLLDARAAEAERAAALTKLRQAQLADGSFPWFPGGPPSPHMTLYVLYGLAKATEFGVEVPRDLVERGWAWLGGHYQSEYVGRAMKEDRGWEFLTFLNYVASCYPEPGWTGDALSPADRAQILEFSLEHWKEHSPYLKAQLALTLKRLNRAADAQRVFDSLMDAATTTPDEGTFWAPEEQAWLWYRDTVETQAFALRALGEIAPADPRSAGLVQWLFLNKQLNHWKSTRATAEAIYSLVGYLQQQDLLAVREEATVRVGPTSQSFTFEPEASSGRAQVVVPGPKLDPNTLGAVVIEKTTPGTLFASATWHYSTEKPPAESRGDLLAVSRRYFKRELRGSEPVLVPLAESVALAPGDEVEVQLTLRARHAAEYLHLRDPRPAGFEPVTQASGYRWQAGLGHYEEIRDSATSFFIEALPAGEYTLRHRLRATSPGQFRVGPATLQSMYAPEFGAFSSGAGLGVGPLRAASTRPAE